MAYTACKTFRLEHSFAPFGQFWQLSKLTSHCLGQKAAKTDQKVVDALSEWYHAHLIRNEAPESKKKVKPRDEAKADEGPTVFRVSIKDTRQCEEEWGAREINAEKLAELKQSMRQMVLDSMVCIGVYFLEPDAPVPRAKDEHFSMQQIVRDGLFLVSGNHRRQALLQLQEEGKSGTQYETMKIVLLACTRQKEDLSKLRHVGHWYNRSEGTIIQTTFLDNMLSMRALWLSLLKIPNEKTRKEKEKSELSSMYAFWTMLKPRINLSGTLQKALMMFGTIYFVIYTESISEH